LASEVSPQRFGRLGSLLLVEFDDELMVAFVPFS
jgi:hypothetical protein